MATDVLVSRELESLRNEMSAVKAQRGASAPPSQPSPTIVPPAVTPPERDEAETDVQLQLVQLTKELTEWFNEAEKGISAHPARSVAGALFVGILIGRLLRRR